MESTARPRRKSPRLEGFDYSESRCYFVTTCTFRRRRAFTDARLNRTLLAHLHEQAKIHGVMLHAWCLMSDHLHLLVEMPGDGLSLSEWVGRLKGLTSRRVRSMGFRGWLWQGQFHEHILRREESIERVAEYIVHNPVRKGLVETWVEYPWAGMGIEDIKV